MKLASVCIEKSLRHASAKLVVFLFLTNIYFGLSFIRSNFTPMHISEFSCLSVEPNSAIILYLLSGSEVVPSHFWVIYATIFVEYFSKWIFVTLTQITMTIVFFLLRGFWLSQSSITGNNKYVEHCFVQLCLRKPFQYCRNVSLFNRMQHTYLCMWRL